MTGKAAVFAFGRMQEGVERLGNPFVGTSETTLPTREYSVTLDVFVSKSSPVAKYFDEAAGKAIYLIGRASHPTLTDEALLRWCGQATADNPAAFRTLLGPFVVVIEDRRARRVSFVTDPLALLPWFVGSSGGRLVAGTDVLGICDAGLSTGQVDYDSVASWLLYNFVCTGGSVVQDYRRLPPGTVSTFTAAGEPILQTTYASLSYTRDVVPPEELIEGLHDRVRASFEQLTRGVDEVNLPLSGGYDSRLLCAMAADTGRPRVRLTVVESTPQESRVARQVAEALRLPLRVLPVGRSNVDLFDDPLYFLPEGFPIARNLTNAVARMHPGMPVLSGFMGDALMRGPINAAVQNFLAQDDGNLDDASLAAAANSRFRIQTNRLHLLRDSIAAAAQARATAAMQSVIEQGRATGRPLAFSNLYLRHRVYFACIFLSHLEVADALLPFSSWNLIQYHASHNGSFAADTYDRLFQRFYPALGGIPHESRVEAAAQDVSPARPSRHLQRWGSELLTGVAGKLNRTAITPRKLIKRLPNALLKRGRYADEIGYLHRIHSFEERLRRGNVDLDWSRMG